MVKETGKFEQERRVQFTCYAHFWSLNAGVGCLVALAGRYKPLTRFCHKPYDITTDPQDRAPHLLHVGCIAHSHKHTVELVVQQKMSSLGEPRTRPPNILTLSERIPGKPPRWKVVAEPQKIPGFLASGEEEFNPGPETRLDCSELLCNRVLLMYKRDRGSFWHRHQKRAERIRPH